MTVRRDRCIACLLGLAALAAAGVSLDARCAAGARAIDRAITSNDRGLRALGSLYREGGAGE